MPSVLVFMQEGECYLDFSLKAGSSICRFFWFSEGFVHPHETERLILFPSTAFIDYTVWRWQERSTIDNGAAPHPSDARPPGVEKKEKMKSVAFAEIQRLFTAEKAIRLQVWRLPTLKQSPIIWVSGMMPQYSIAALD